MQIIRFGLVGILNTLIDFGILNGLIFLFDYPKGFLLVVCNSVAVLCASLNSYFMNKNWTFIDKRSMSVNQFTRFLVFTLTGMAINSFLVFILTSPWFFPDGLADLIWINAAKVIATLGSMLWNYTCYKKFVFGRPAIG